MAQYQQYEQLLSLVQGKKLGTWFNYMTPTQVRKIFESYRTEGGRLRIYNGDTKTGRSWMDENWVIGEIGRSSGLLQIPLLMETGEVGGTGILDSCIVRIQDADTREELYRHKQFHLPMMEIKPTEGEIAKSYSHEVWVANRDNILEVSARFQTFGKAAHWVAFMHGESMEKPQ